MDPPVSLHVCSFHKPHMDPLEFIACVFFSQTMYVSTSVIEMCVLFIDHKWIHQSSLHLCSFHRPYMDPPVSLHVCCFRRPYMDPQVSLHVCSFHKPHIDPPFVIACVFFLQTTY